MADPPEIEKAIRDFQSGRDRGGGFRVIHRTYLRAVKGFFRRRGFTHEEVEDLTQETFFRVYRNMDAYQHRGTFGAWLFTVADSVCQGEWERRRTQKRSGLEIPYEEDPEPGGGESGERANRPVDSPGLTVGPRQEEQFQQKQLREKVVSAIEELPRRQRQCMTLRLREYRYDEIATLLQIKRETVKQHLMAARKRLRELLGDFYLPSFDDLPDPDGATS